MDQLYYYGPFRLLMLMLQIDNGDGLTPDLLPTVAAVTSVCHVFSLLNPTHKFIIRQLDVSQHHLPLDETLRLTWFWCEF